MRDLEEAFAEIPIDPRTGYPAGFLGFAVELDARQGAAARAREGEALEFLGSLREQARSSLRA